MLTLAGSGAFTRGTITEGVGPDGLDLDDTPADNITPVKVVGGGALHRAARPLVGRSTASARRPTSTAWRTTLLDSPFLIAQDLLSLDGFAVQRLAWGVNLSRRRDRVGVTFAIENLTNTYYREHFQFAPSRGRSFTVGLSIGAFN